MNATLFNLIHGLVGRSRILDGVAIFMADILPYLLVLAALYFALTFRGSRRKMFVAVEMGLAVLLSHNIINNTIRYFYHRLRPFAELGFVPLILGKTPDNSFASGHMTIFFAMATVIFCLNRRWGSWFLILSLVMGLARIYTGIHWPLDILGGALIGIAAGTTIHFLVRRYWISIEKGVAEIAGTNM